MIGIATHKLFKNPNLMEYIPIHVGAAISTKLPYQGDDIGDNISMKNNNFCELTALYWMWKNVTDEYKGLVHYRRYFSKNCYSSMYSQLYRYDELTDLLKNYDIILPKPSALKQTAENEIKIKCCDNETFNKLREIVNNNHSDYLNEFDTFFKQNKVSLFNMMFCKAELFDSYCEWLFSILFDLEKCVDMTNFTDYQKRLYGFLSERLLNIWVKKERLKVKHLSVINTETTLYQKICNKRRNITNSILFNLVNILKFSTYSLIPQHIRQKNN